MINKEEELIDIATLLRLFRCPGCNNPVNNPPIFQCVKGRQQFLEKF